ncbi:hypothetical protein EZS27_018384 [termite gut metagenome]|uniref:Uncharacterized protein n=1 Tax=termite gut metagenome TaxID=433724 RepID=A0A5J4RGK7_9ZZZZ
MLPWGNLVPQLPLNGWKGNIHCMLFYPYQKIEGALLTIPVSSSQTQIDSSPRVASATLSYSWAIYLDIAPSNSGNQVQEAFPTTMNRAVATMVRCVRYEKETG